MKNIFVIILTVFFTSASGFANQSSVIQNLKIRWEQMNPEVLDSYNHMTPDDQELLTVYRGIDHLNSISQVNLDQRDRTFNFGPFVYTSEDLNVSIVYAAPTRYGQDLACDALILKLSIPKGFFQSRDAIQDLIPSSSPYADLRLFITDLGFISHSKLKEQFLTNKVSRREAQIAALKWFPISTVSSSDLTKIKSPDLLCQSSDNK